MNRLLHLSGRALALLLIVLPVGVYALYLGLIARDRFVSESVISVRQAGSSAASALPGAALLLAGINPPAHEDTLYLRSFIHSQALALELDRTLGLRKHFADVGTDLPYRLPADASTEQYVAYFRNRVELGFDDRAALLTVRTQGLDPAFAQRFNAAVLDASERFVNETSHRIARERLRFAEGELQTAAERVETATGAVLAFQSKNRVLDPGVQAQAAGMLTAELQANRARLEAELGGLRGFLNEEAYQVQALKARIAAIDRQIDAERRRATAEDNRGNRLNKQALDFEALKLRAEFARDAYKLSLAAVENARIEAQQKIKSLAIVEPPSLPETAEYPLVAYNMGTLIAVCVLLFAIVRLVLATIREHQD